MLTRGLTCTFMPDINSNMSDKDVVAAEQALQYIEQRESADSTVSSEVVVHMHVPACVLHVYTISYLYMYR